jgi:hypothetical protein
MVGTKEEYQSGMKHHNEVGVQFVDFALDAQPPAKGLTDSGGD